MLAVLYSGIRQICRVFRLFAADFAYLLPAVYLVPNANPGCSPVFNRYFGQT